MGSIQVMRNAPHGRFFVNGRGVLMERQAHGQAKRTRFGIEASRATRSELQALAEMLNQNPALDVEDAAVERLWALHAEGRHQVPGSSHVY